MKFQATSTNVNRLVQGSIIFIAACTTVAFILQILHTGSFSIIPASVSAQGVSQADYAQKLAGILLLWKVLLAAAFLIILFVWCLVWKRWMGRFWTYISEKSRLSSTSTATRSIIFILTWSLITHPMFLLSAGLSVITPDTFLNILKSRAVIVPLSALAYYITAKRCNRGAVFAILFSLRILYFSREIYQIHKSTSMYPALERNESNEIVFKLAEQANFPVDNVKNSYGTSNASYLNTLFNEHIVIGSEIQSEDLGAIMAHELGHRKNKDHLTLYTLISIDMFIDSALPSLIIPAFPILYEAFGFTTEPIVAAISISEFISFILEEFLTPIKLMLLRRAEYRADNYASELGHGKSLIIYFYKGHWKAIFSANSLFEFLFLSHPSGLKRITALQKAEEGKYLFGA